MAGQTMRMTGTYRMPKDEELGKTGPSPGPIYLPKGVGGIGTSVVSHVGTQARVVVGTAPRFYEHHDGDTPGPGAYTVALAKGPSYSVRSRETFGTQTAGTATQTPGPGTHGRLETSMTRKQNAPAYTLRGRRAILKNSTITPAPGHTQHVAAASEKQVLAGKPNIPGILFGTSERRAADAGGSTGELGPGEYANGDITLLTGHRKPPKYTMGVKPKERGALRVQPQLYLVPGGVGKQVVSSLKTAPAFTMSGRVKFGSPY